VIKRKSVAPAGNLWPSRLLSAGVQHPHQYDKTGSLPIFNALRIFSRTFLAGRDAAQVDLTQISVPFSTGCLLKRSCRPGGKCWL